MLKVLKYAALAFMVLCTLFVVYGIGRGIVKGWNKAEVRRSTSSGMPRDVWISRFKPIELAGLCTDSPLQRSLHGNYQDCISIVEPLFDRCASSSIINIPAVIGSRAEAEKYGSLVGECIAAHHFGGSHLDSFNASLQMRTKA